MHLNQASAALCDRLVQDAEKLRIGVDQLPAQTRMIDCGVHAPGGLEAGKRLAEICMAGLGHVRFAGGDPQLWPGPWVCVLTDHPVAACLASQYAGWEISGDGYLAMGSGPMRAAAAREPVFSALGHRETTDVAVGVLESSRLPPPAVTRTIAEKCAVAADRLTLLVAPTTSQAGTVQVVARSIETAMHKLHELGFDVARIESGIGTAPLPPVAADTVTAIGRTNDAIIYGAQVTLYARGDDESLFAMGTRVPSQTSADFGEPFRRIFQRYAGDFYRIDPLLFSPAVLLLVNLDTGRSARFGCLRPDVLHKSFVTE